MSRVQLLIQLQSYANRIVEGSKNLIDTAVVLDGNGPQKIIFINCYVSYDCYDDDQLGDVFQAMIDTTCTLLAKNQALGTHVKISMLLPGAAADDDDVYDLGDQVNICMKGDYISLIVDRLEIRESGSNNVICYQLQYT